MKVRTEAASIANNNSVYHFGAPEWATPCKMGGSVIRVIGHKVTGQGYEVMTSKR